MKNSPYLRWANSCEKPIVIRNRNSKVTNQSTLFHQADNSTDDLEVRVTLLEDDVTDLQDEVQELETDNTLQDERFNTVEGNVAKNSNDIGGKPNRSPFSTFQNFMLFIRYL